MNHVFLMQVHQHPRLVERILRKLAAPNHFFLINVDGKCSAELAREMREAIVASGVSVVDITRMNIMHGGFSQIDCTLRQMRSALAGGAVDAPPSFDYYHTISGQDYPCVSKARFDHFFEDSCARDSHRSFLWIDPPESLRRWRLGKYRRRLDHWWFHDSFNGPVGKRLRLGAVARRLLWFMPRSRIDYDEVYGGWNWFSLHLSAVEWLMGYVDEHPEYVRRFHHTDCGDELFFNTLLMRGARAGVDLDLVTDNSLRFVEWHPKRKTDSLPLVLEESEFDEIEASGALFCRKVDPVASAVLLDKIDASVSCADSLDDADVRCD